jgi:hypothetical protein
MSGSTIMVHIDDGERVQGEVRLLYPPGDPLLELTLQVGHRERVSFLWRGKGAIGEARATLGVMGVLLQGLENAQVLREQGAEAAPGEAQEGAQAPLAASEGHGRAGGGALGALEGSEGPSRGILATPAPAPAHAAPAAPWAGTDRECLDCGGLRPLWHEPSCVQAGPGTGSRATGGAE